ncbi:hypothetical protein [Haloparvum sedimenti]|uniref:hypothetical protein n=1 Tax=Haloparvum sedimenti TaxID=1678448 RepID=UPI00071E746F|nr:hypothetical protein [Haloparvum sedimenti]
MVGPLSDEDRAAGNAKLKVGFVALVTASAGLVAFQVGASPAGVGAALGGGLLAALALLWYLLRLAGEFGSTRRR